MFKYHKVTKYLNENLVEAVKAMAQLGRMQDK